jgi:tetratricopeptide (TPR) repeat protein
MALDAQYYLAAIDLRLGDLLGAKAKLEEILRKDPNYERAWLLLGEVARRRYLVDEAKNAFLKAKSVIEAKLSRINAELSRPVSIQRYGELMSQKETLETMRAQAIKALEELP